MRGEVVRAWKSFCSLVQGPSLKQCFVFKHQRPRFSYSSTKPNLSIVVHKTFFGVNFTLLQNFHFNFQLKFLIRVKFTPTSSMRLTPAFHREVSRKKEKITLKRSFALGCEGSAASQLIQLSRGEPVNSY